MHTIDDEAMIMMEMSIISACIVATTMSSYAHQPTSDSNQTMVPTEPGMRSAIESNTSAVLRPGRGPQWSSRRARHFRVLPNRLSSKRPHTRRAPSTVPSVVSTVRSSSYRVRRHFRSIPMPFLWLDRTGGCLWP